MDGEFYTGDEATIFLDGEEKCHMSGWTLTLRGNLKKKGVNCDRLPRRITGRPDVTGTMVYNFARGEIIPVQHGARYRAQFHFDDSAANYIELYIKIEDIPIPADIDNGHEFESNISWGADGGELTIAGVGAGSSSA